MPFEPTYVSDPRYIEAPDPHQEYQDLSWICGEISLRADSKIFLSVDLDPAGVVEVARRDKGLFAQIGRSKTTGFDMVIYTTTKSPERFKTTAFVLEAKFELAEEASSFILNSTFCQP